MNQALLQAAIVTFEEFGFMFPVEREAGSPLNAGDCLKVAIDFAGPISGKFILKIERRILPLVAENMLGEEVPFEEAMLNDVAGEIANVICGNALPKIGGKEAVFDLGPPQIVAKTEIPEKIAAQVNLQMDEGCADALLSLN